MCQLKYKLEKGDKKQGSNMRPVCLASLSFSFSICEVVIKYEPHRILKEK